MFLKMGKQFPTTQHARTHDIRYAAAIAAALKTELGDSHQAIKIVMRWTGANERTVKNWMAGSSGPSGAHLVALARYSDQVLSVFLTLANRDNVIASTEIIRARDVLAKTLRQIDKLIGSTGPDGTK